MDGLLTCAKAFEDLLPVKYHIIIGRKGKSPFQKIEALFDKNDLVFRYNRKLQALSLIEAEYLLSTPHEYTDVYIFLDKKDEAGNFFCRSFFPKEDRDYTKGQAVYTLLKKEKINIDTGTVQIQYDRLSPKDKD